MLTDRRIGHSPGQTLGFTGAASGFAGIVEAKVNWGSTPILAIGTIFSKLKG